MRSLLEEFKGIVHDKLPKGLPPLRDFQYYILRVSLPNISHYEMNPKESKVLKEKVRLKLKKINTKYKATTDKKRWEELFEERDVEISNTFNVANLFEYHLTKQLCPD